MGSYRTAYNISDLREIARSLSDHGLDILRGSVKVATQVELQGDLGRTLAARGGHRVEAGDGRELLFESLRDGRSHGVGRGAAQSRDEYLIDETGGDGRRADAPFNIVFAVDIGGCAASDDAGGGNP